MINEKLSKIQAELKVPKGQMNSFGGYKYRSCEDILESVKPILAKHKVVLVLSDEVVCVGNRNYVRAEATLNDFEDNESITVQAFAREEETKKGMDGSQITGASSSYARKYALNGLFNIDDTRDSDATNKGPDPVKSEFKFKNGKYIGKTLKEVAGCDIEYLRTTAISEKCPESLKLEIKKIIGE